MIIPQKKVKAFQKEILDWYAVHKRVLPWRDVPVGTSLDQKAYRILVSEIMLQQTQVSRVIPKYEAWLKAFPTVEKLAKAKTSEVLKHWSGLGYNRRALYLQKCAKTVVERFQKTRKTQSVREVRKSEKSENQIFPKTIEELKKLPGIGEYTAAAVACFAFGKQVAVVDTNIRKVILLKFATFEKVSLEKVSKVSEVPQVPQVGFTQLNNRHCEEQSDEAISSKRLPRSLHSLAMISKEIQEIADQLLPKGRASEWNQALMDYAAAVLKKEKIPIPKQSKFVGSNRYYRGQIIKLLLQKKERTIAEVANIMGKDEAFIEKIVGGLIKDAFIQRRKNSIVLAGST